MAGETYYFNLLPALITVVGAMWLAYTILSPERLKKALNKHPPESHDYKLYRKIYSRQFLNLWLVITFSSIIGAIFAIYRDAWDSPYVFLLELGLQVIALAVIVKMWIKIIKKK